MKILCYIGARGGSRRLKRKNIQKYGDTNLLEYAIRNALKSRYIDMLVVDSEDEEILDYVQGIKNNVKIKDGHYSRKIFMDFLIHKRDPKLSEDGVCLYEPLREVLNEYIGYPVVVILQADTPVKNVDIIDKCIGIFFEHENAEDVCTFHDGLRTGAVRVISRDFFFNCIPTAKIYSVEDRPDFVDIHTYDDLIKANYYLENPYIPESPETFRVADKIKEPIDYNTRMIYNHFNRYSTAIQSLGINKNDVVMDASCGQGYGSYLLSLHAKRVWGLDINKDYLKKAEEFYKTDNIYFHTYDGYNKFNSGNLRFIIDKIVCIETIEHMRKEEQAPFIQKLLSYLVKGGDMFLTAPLGKNEKSSYNQFHLCEPSLDFLEKTLTHNFNKCSIVIDNFVNSYGRETEYCMISLYGYKGGD